MDRVMNLSMGQPLFNVRKQTRAPGLMLVVGAHIAIALTAIYAVNELPPRIERPVTQVTVPIELPPPPPVPVRRVEPTPRNVPVVPTPMPPTPIPEEPPPTVQSENVPQAPSTPTPTSAPQIAGEPGLPTGNSTGGTSSDVAVVCPNVRVIQANMRYPVQARRDSMQGDVVVQFTLTAAGQVRDPRVLSAPGGINGPLGRAAVAAVREFQCVGQGRDVIVEAPFAFRLND